MTIDYSGGPCSAATWIGEGNRLTRRRTAMRTNSLGRFYWDCTQYLGFGLNRDGKTMGLAAYGNPASAAASVASLLETDGLEWYAYRRPPSEPVLGFARRDGQDLLASPYPHLAAAVQAALETSVQRWFARRWSTPGAATCASEAV